MLRRSAGLLAQCIVLGRRVPEANLDSVEICFRDAFRVARRKPRVTLGLGSHFGPVRCEWLFHKAPAKIIETLPYHDNNVGTQSTGLRADLNSCSKNPRNPNQETQEGENTKILRDQNSILYTLGAVRDACA